MRTAKNIHNQSIMIGNEEYKFLRTLLSKDMISSSVLSEFQNGMADSLYKKGLLDIEKTPIGIIYKNIQKKGKK